MIVGFVQSVKLSRMVDISTLFHASPEGQILTRFPGQRTLTSFRTVAHLSDAIELNLPSIGKGFGILSRGL